jgi:hypothetical protein
MKRFGFAAVSLLVGLVLACSQGSESTDSRPGLDVLRTALEERDGLERMYLLSGFLRTLRAEDVPAVVAEFEKHRTGVEDEEVRLLMLAWTRLDGPAAFATARDWPTPWKSVLMEQAMYAWGFQDGRAALAECEKIEDEELRESLRPHLVAGWVASDDRIGASEYAATISDGRRRSRFALRLAGNAKRDGAEAVIAWVDAVPEDAPNDFKATAFSHAAGAVARLDFERAVSWYESHMQHSYSSGGLRNIANKGAQYHDPSSLVAWIETLPIEADRETERADALRSAFRIWAGEAPGEVEAWLESASAGPTRDVAIGAFVRETVAESPAEAARWVVLIEDDELRRKYMLRTTRRWFAKDPAAAGAWLAGADISDDWRQQIVGNAPQASRWFEAVNAESGE